MRLLRNGELTVDFDDDCPATRAILDVLGDKWSARVLAILGSGAMRFNHLRRSIDGISQRVLTSTLRGLERDGLVRRTAHQTNPPQVDYALTELGRTLLGPIGALATWAERHRAEMRRAREVFEEKDVASHPAREETSQVLPSSSTSRIGRAVLPRRA